MREEVKRRLEENNPFFVPLDEDVFYSFISRSSKSRKKNA